MREVMNAQPRIGSIPIAAIKHDLLSRDETPKVLLGLQKVITNEETRKKLFSILETLIPENVDKKVGRPGMGLWEICVLGVVRLNSDWNYDKLHDIANNHKAIRQMLGHGIMDDDCKYALQTLKDNLKLLTQEHSDQISVLIVQAAHEVLEHKPEEDLHGSCDSYVVETNVHYSTDANVLNDAIRVMVRTTAYECSVAGIPGWGKSNYIIKQFKKELQRLQNLKRSTSKNKEKKEKKDQEIRTAYMGYTVLAETYILKVRESLIELMKSKTTVLPVNTEEITDLIVDARRQIDHIRRRVCNAEKIPHVEKVFSIFEKHTEWICKGKAGVPQELGLRICILKDQYGFILYHFVMEQQTDDKVAVMMVKEAKARFPNLNSCSFDRGFYSPQNRIDLSEELSQVTMPKKGKLSAAEKIEEHSEEFLSAKRKHSAVESTINALENSGLNRCPDHGIEGFKRYAGLAVLARNLQTLGNIIQQKELKKLKKQKKL